MIELLGMEHDAIRFAVAAVVRMSREWINYEELERELRSTGNPIGVAFLDGVLEAVDRIENPRDRSLARDLVLLGLWKVLAGSSYQHCFYRACENLSRNLAGVPFSRYCVSPESWPVNKGYRLHVAKKHSDALQ
jgi:hypothetical protein